MIFGEGDDVAAGHIHLQTKEEKQMKAQNITYARALPLINCRLVANVVLALLASYQP